MRSFSRSLLLVTLLTTTPALCYAQPAADDKPAADKPATTSAAAAPVDNAETYRLLKLFGDVFERVRAQYVEPVKDEELIEAALNGMLTHLDPHSNYLNRDEFKDMSVQTRGEFGGLGIEVTMENNAVKVITPIDDTPASKAGLQSGDLIVALDGQLVSGYTLQEAVNKMRGPVGTQIKLTVVRGKAEPFDLTITRAVIRVESVKWRTEGNVGYLRISSFTDRTQDGVDRAIAEISKKLGDKLEGWVLDLRNNPGGLLEQAVSVSDTFLERGEIVSTRARDPEESSRFNATPGDEIGGKPLVVLINNGSASASEIVSGALQDHKRAIILGMKSFGKGSVQSITPLPGYGAIKLTTQRYYTPSGRSIQGEGITPDIVVEPAKVEKLDGPAFVVREADLRGALNNDHPAEKPEEAKPTDSKPEANSADKPADASAKGDEKDPSKDDYQLTRALDLIHGMALYGNSLKSANDTASKDTAK